MIEPGAKFEYPSNASNPDLFGHMSAENDLLRAFSSDRLHHAWLISGPRGIGKATLAFRFARFIFANYEAPKGLFADAPDQLNCVDSLVISQEHPVFQRVASGGHADLLVVERSKNERGVLRSEIVINDIRKAQHFLHMTAGEGGWRIVIVDSADEMNTNAANALLKLLEEPPPKALLLIISHNPNCMLPTIRSRCQKLRLQPLSAPNIFDWLSINVPNSESADFEATCVISEGSIGRAAQLLKLDGARILTDIIKLLENLPNIDSVDLHAFATRCAQNKDEGIFNLSSELILWELSRIIKYLSGVNLVNLIPEEQLLFKNIANISSLENWLEVWENVDDLLSSVAQANLDRKHVILNTFAFVSKSANV